jgi:hypothetical protein
MANMDVGAWRHSEVRSQSHSSAFDFSDDGLDFPPTAHPVRELNFQHICFGHCRPDHLGRL